MALSVASLAVSHETATIAQLNSTWNSPSPSNVAPSNSSSSTQSLPALALSITLSLLLLALGIWKRWSSQARQTRSITLFSLVIIPHHLQLSTPRELIIFFLYCRSDSSVIFYPGISNILSQREHSTNCPSEEVHGPLPSLPRPTHMHYSTSRS
jgi:hypothetical protein